MVIYNKRARAHKESIENENFKFDDGTRADRFYSIVIVRVEAFWFYYTNCYEHCVQ